MTNQTVFLAPTLRKSACAVTLLLVASCGAILPDTSPIDDPCSASEAAGCDNSVPTPATIAQTCGPELAGARIGPAGGLVEVTDPSSPLHGTKLTVPAGALTAPVWIGIAGGDDLTRGTYQSVSPSVCLRPLGLALALPATLQVPVDPKQQAMMNGALVAQHDGLQPSMTVPDEPSSGAPAVSAATQIQKLQTFQIVRKGAHGADFTGQDILSYFFTVDNSEKMVNRQAQLASNLDGIFKTISESTYLNMGARSPALWRLGVLTTSALDSKANWDPKRGELINTFCTTRGLAKTADCMARCGGLTEPAFLATRRYLTSDDVATYGAKTVGDWFHCLAIVGSTGTNNPMPYGNALQVVQRVNDDTMGKTGYKGFLANMRQYRHAAIMVMSDQDDCSLDPATTDPQKYPQAVFGQPAKVCIGDPNRGDKPECYPQDVRCPVLGLKCKDDLGVPQDLTAYGDDPVFVNCRERTKVRDGSSFFMEVRADLLPRFGLTFDLDKISLTTFTPLASRADQQHAPKNMFEDRTIGFCTGASVPHLEAYYWCTEDGGIALPQLRHSELGDWLGSGGAFQAPQPDGTPALNYEMSVCIPKQWLAGFCQQLVDLYKDDKTKLCAGL